MTANEMAAGRSVGQPHGVSLADPTADAGAVGYCLRLG